jgi:hypothetical protein
MKRGVFCVFVIFSSVSLFSQSSADVAVQLTANAQNNPAQITLNWIGNATSSQYQVFKKLKHAISWGLPIATLNGTTNQYIDNAVTIGTNYEYQIYRIGTGYSGFGYIDAGIEVPEIDFRGKLILIVDSDFVTTLAPEIKRLIADIEGDGWEVLRHDVLRVGTVTHVKELIVNDFNLDSANTKAVFILGHVPVPYSGNINPDGHGDHLGAWPADCYYADIDGIWTDIFVTSTTASPARTQNTPGDGKFDQSIVPSDLELQVGRADFNGMPTFTLTELQLLKNYLDKDHDYRKKIFAPVKRAVIDDNFGYFGTEAFAGSGYKNFSPLVGSANISAADYFTTMTGNSYLWSYGCGGGTYSSAGGIGNTGNFATSNLQGVFTMLFGSYFGDWDSQNNFLKAPLAQGKILTSVWSGRPHYQFHHMAMGENIGYDVLLTQNNPGNLYFASPTSITGRWVHNALMGDPTLRNDVVAPVSNVIATKSGYDCVINWSASTETTLVGYNIYMKNDSNSTYTKINTIPIAGTSYTDNCLLFQAVYSYMVRALKLENTPSGTYYNISEGIADTAYNSSNIKTYASFTSSISGNGINVTNTSFNAVSYFWDFGNGVTSTSVNPSVTYTLNNSFLITLISTNGCSHDTAYEAITISEVGINELMYSEEVALFPNPSTGKIKVSNKGVEKMEITISNIEGKKIWEHRPVIEGETLDLGYLSKGMYFVELRMGSNQRRAKLIIE